MVNYNLEEQEVEEHNTSYYIIHSDNNYNYVHTPTFNASAYVNYKVDTGISSIGAMNLRINLALCLNEQCFPNNIPTINSIERNFSKEEYLDKPKLGYFNKADN